ncbi:MAG: hypothetical protein ACI4I8_02095 [Oscillospiraceae bacterium]
MEQFTTAFSATSDILAYIAGVAAAILIPALALLLCLGLLSWCFDRITAAMARRWHRKNKRPRSRIGQIIYDRAGGV